MLTINIENLKKTKIYIFEKTLSLSIFTVRVVMNMKKYLMKNQFKY